MESAVARTANQETAVLKEEFGPISRWLGARYFDGVHFPPESEVELRELHTQGFVVHVMRSTAWINFLYLAWAMVRRALPPIRAVVNLRPWFTRPFRNTAQRGDFDVRFTYARRHGGSGLIFLKKTALMSPSGKDIEENPFPALVAMARKGDRNVFLVPELFVWEKRTARIKPGLMDRVFGSPEAPGFVHSMVAFFRNYRRAQFRVGEPIDLQRFIAGEPAGLGRGDRPQGAQRPAPPPGPGDSRRLRPAHQAARAAHRRDDARPAAAQGPGRVRRLRGPPPGERLPRGPAQPAGHRRAPQPHDARLRLARTGLGLPAHLRRHRGG